jgi:hypothetical protein
LVVSDFDSDIPPIRPDAERAAEIDRRDRAGEQRAAVLDARESACGERERETELLIEAAARRDEQAKQRDAAADRRDFLATLHYELYGIHAVDPSEVRQRARGDRVDAKADRLSSEADRYILSAAAPPSPRELTIEQAIAAAIHRVKARNSSGHWT